jgi:hypothetical protein
MPADARPQVRKKGRRIRCNTLRIVSADNDAGACRSFAAVEWYNSDRVLSCRPSVPIAILRAETVFLEG